MSEEKTEKPTDKKLRDAKEKGQVSQSKDIVSTATLAALCLMLIAASDMYFSRLADLLTLPSTFYERPFIENLKIGLEGIIREIAILTAFPLLTVVVAAIVSNFLQIGPIFSFDPIKPKFDKFNFITNLKNMFAAKSLIEFLKSIIKVCILSFAVYYILKESFNDSVKLHYCGVDCISPFIAELLKQLMLITLIIFFIISIADFYIQKAQFIKQQKMSKEEVKKEYKQTEGNPEIKSKRKSIHREMLDSSVKQKVKKSSVIITNPTHIAIGIYYEKGIEDVPKIMVKGADRIATAIKKIAREENIPIMENVPLARGLWEQANVDEYVPVELFEAVAMVLQWVNSLDDQKEKGQGDQ